jgi:hypothetical protein
VSLLVEAKVLPHALVHLLQGNVDFGKVRVLSDELARVQSVVGATSLEDLGLVLDREVLPLKVGIDVLQIDVGGRMSKEGKTGWLVVRVSSYLLVEGEHFIVRSGAGVGEVVDSLALLLGHVNGDGQQVGEDGHRVGHVDDLLVLADLRDEVPGVEVIRDGHAKPEGEHVGVGLQQLLGEDLGARVEGTLVVGRILLLEALAADGVLSVVLVDAPAGVVGDVDSLQEASVHEVNSAHDVGAAR